MINNITHHILLRTCRPLKKKYNLSVNVVMVLNGVYLLYSITGQPFTKFKLRSFLSYFNSKLIDKYIYILIERNLIALAGLRSGRQVYTITQLGIDVINDFNQSYKDQLYLFCEKYNIEL